jgi:hypothetical protein
MARLLRDAPSQSLRLVVIAPDSLYPDASDAHAMQQAERSRLLRISLLENGYNIVAVLPTWRTRAQGDQLLRGLAPVARGWSAPTTRTAVIPAKAGSKASM